MSFTWLTSQIIKGSECVPVCNSQSLCVLRDWTKPGRTLDPTVETRRKAQNFLASVVVRTSMRTESFLVLSSRTCSIVEVRLSWVGLCCHVPLREPQQNGRRGGCPHLLMTSSSESLSPHPPHSMASALSHRGKAASALMLSDPCLPSQTTLHPQTPHPLGTESIKNQDRSFQMNMKAVSVRVKSERQNF